MTCGSGCSLLLLVRVSQWHLGFFTQAHTPVGRGFDTSFGFFCGDSTHDTRGSQVSHTCKLSITDLYNSTRPANESGPHGGWATNRVYNTHMYATLAEDVIAAHAKDYPTQPMYPLLLLLLLLLLPTPRILSERLHHCTVEFCA